MKYTELRIMVEGYDDEKLFDLLRPLIKYAWVTIVQCANRPNSWKAKFVKSTDASSHADYLYVADIDAAPCVTKRKNRLVEQIPALEGDRIIVVVREIEAWYLAGVPDQDARALGFVCPGCTDGVTKEVFLRLMPKRFNSAIDFKAELLKRFSSDVAISRSGSFAYLLKRLERLY